MDLYVKFRTGSSLLKLIFMVNWYEAVH